MPRILVTNDDGYFAEGIKSLAAALEAVGEVFVVAPATEQSATSHSLTLTRPLRVRKLDEHHYTVDGTPTDCVILAVTTILKDTPPDIVVSGINHGANVGDDVIYSGTVAGALEGAICGLPGIAVSLLARDGDFSYAAEFAAKVTRKVLDEGLPPHTILNVNVPVGPVRDVRWVRQGTKGAQTSITSGTDPRGLPYLWIGAQKFFDEVEPDTDYAAMRDGVVSITPLRADLTDDVLLEKWKNSGAGFSL
jgi:5'-nucleotidase